MYHKIREAQMGDREEGFTLIELLVVVIIIGILAAIAIPVFLNQREKAWKKAATSDVRNAAIEVESYFADNNEYPADQAAFNTLNIQTSAGVVSPLTYTLDGASDQAYCIEADQENLGGTGNVDAAYDSDNGGVQENDACA